MSNVALTIGGRAFTIACADGEEDHVRELGRIIERKVEASGMAGQSESRMLLFAALLLADENHELAVRAPAAAAPDVRPAEDTARPALTDEQAGRLARIAARLENLADLLER